MTTPEFLIPPWLSNHRGPYRFCVTRDKGARIAPRHRYSSEWLKGGTEREDVPGEASALLTDPRDSITSVSVWSESESQFIGGYRR